MPVIIKIELIVMFALLAVFLWLLLGVIQQPESENADQTAPRIVEPTYMEYGTGSGLEISSVAFVAPDTKNNLDLVEFAKQAWIHQWGYVWGTFGTELTDQLLAMKIQQYPEGVGDFEEFIRENWLGRRTVDCVGLIKAYGWYDPHGGSIDYGTNGMEDCDTEDMFAAATEKGAIDTLPEIPGIILYYEGHVGIYIGNGYVIEAYGTETGVVKTKLEQRPFTHWMKCPYIFYYKQ